MQHNTVMNDSLVLLQFISSKCISIFNLGPRVKITHLELKSAECSDPPPDFSQFVKLSVLTLTETNYSLLSLPSSITKLTLINNKHIKEIPTNSLPNLEYLKFSQEGLLKLTPKLSAALARNGANNCQASENVTTCAKNASLIDSIKISQAEIHNVNINYQLDFGQGFPDSPKSNNVQIVPIVCICIFLFIFLLLSFLILRKRKQQNNPQESKQASIVNHEIDNNETKNHLSLSVTNSSEIFQLNGELKTESNTRTSTSNHQQTILVKNQSSVILNECESIASSDINDDNDDNSNHIFNEKNDSHIMRTLNRESYMPQRDTITFESQSNVHTFPETEIIGNSRNELGSNKSPEEMPGTHAYPITIKALNS